MFPSLGSCCLDGRKSGKLPFYLRHWGDLQCSDRVLTSVLGHRRGNARMQNTPSNQLHGNLPDSHRCSSRLFCSCLVVSEPYDDDQEYIHRRTPPSDKSQFKTRSNRPFATSVRSSVLYKAARPIYCGKRFRKIGLRESKITPRRWVTHIPPDTKFLSAVAEKKT